jgi:hypothetical protein
MKSESVAHLMNQTAHRQFRAHTLASNRAHVGTTVHLGLWKRCSYRILIYLRRWQVTWRRKCESNLVNGCCEFPDAGEFTLFPHPHLRTNVVPQNSEGAGLYWVRTETAP